MKRIKLLTVIKAISVLAFYNSTDQSFDYDQHQTLVVIIIMRVSLMRVSHQQQKQSTDYAA